MQSLIADMQKDPALWEFGKVAFPTKAQDDLIHEGNPDALQEYGLWVTAAHVLVAIHTEWCQKGEADEHWVELFFEEEEGGGFYTSDMVEYLGNLEPEVSALRRERVAFYPKHVLDALSSEEVLESLDSKEALEDAEETSGSEGMLFSSSAEQVLDHS